MVFRWTGNRRGGGGGVYAEAGEYTLVKGLRQGDPDAFAALFSLYSSRIYNYVARFVGDPEDAKDVTQEVFIKAFRKIPTDDPGLALKPWLYRVATTTCIDHLRARRRRGEPSSVTSEELPALGDAYEQGETSLLVQETLDRLSDRHRLVLLLKDVHGLRHDEIAAIMGVSRGATETLLFRARATFRRAFLDPDAATPSRQACRETRRAALAMAGGAPAGERRRALDHARTCRDCRKVVRKSKSGDFGLAMLLPALVTPKALTWASLIGGGAGGASSLGAGAGGGLLAKLGSAATAKIAIVAAATVTIAGTGVVVEQGRKSARRAGSPAIAAERGGDRSARRAATPAPQPWAAPGSILADRGLGHGRPADGEKTSPPGGDPRIASTVGQEPGQSATNGGLKSSDGDQATADSSVNGRTTVGNVATSGSRATSSHVRGVTGGPHRHPQAPSRHKGKNGTSITHRR
jgi:RNA polymerase sigma-70 factor, ECF subfamily